MHVTLAVYKTGVARPRPRPVENLFFLPTHSHLQYSEAFSNSMYKSYSSLALHCLKIFVINTVLYIMLLIWLPKQYAKKLC